MTFDETIKLISITTTVDSIGDTVETEVEREVLASVLTYRNKDYYQALTSGLKPSITFGINKHEYQDEKTLKHDGKTYRIIDVFPVVEKDTSEFEALSLLCEAVI